MLSGPRLACEASTAVKNTTLEDDEEEEEEAVRDRPYAASPAGTTRRCLCDLVPRLPTRPRGDSPIDTANSVSDIELPESSGSSAEEKGRR